MISTFFSDLSAEMTCPDDQMIQIAWYVRHCQTHWAWQNPKKTVFDAFSVLSHVLNLGKPFKVNVNRKRTGKIQHAMKMGKSTITRLGHGFNVANC